MPNLPIVRCHGINDAWCGSRPAYHCVIESLQASPQKEIYWPALIEKYGYMCPSREVLDEIADWGPVVELGAGNGYWARLLRDLKADVVAYDNRSWPEVACGTWSKVARGDALTAAKYSDRTLLLIMPPRRRTQEVVGMLRPWKGERLIVGTEGGFPNLTNTSLKEATVYKYLIKKRLSKVNEIITQGLILPRNAHFFRLSTK